ncbi:MAG TPA: hypothetical protein VMW52_02115, partial [Phycisphaerae bacterium]|nr:hypothetical protein [Phycisphaerae bacterium]
MSLRHGVCRIASNDGDGAYTITERYWDASSEAWRDADAPFGFVGADALELNGNACGPASSEPIPFWEERDDAGTVRRFIHLTGFGTGGYRVVAINAHYSGTNTAQFQSIGGVLYARVIVSIQIRQCSGNGAAATHPTYTTGAPENYGGG